MLSARAKQPMAGQRMTTSKGSVRIIGGEHRGRRLHFTDQNGDLRPTGDRMRETLFNWLQFEMGQRHVLDLFAGSGALGAEALSRGAATATLIERKRERAADLSRQLKPLFDGRVRVHCLDALRWIERDTHQYDLVFVDPPYDLGLQEKACEKLDRHRLVTPGGRVYLESRRQEPVPRVPLAWELQREKEAGDVRAQLYLVPTGA